MKLIKIGSNQTEIRKEDGTQILFSYETPVCVNIMGMPCFVTNEKHSNTTTKHINCWTDELPIEYVSQQTIVDMANREMGDNEYA